MAGWTPQGKLDAHARVTHALLDEGATAEVACAAANAAIEHLPDAQYVAIWAFAGGEEVVGEPRATEAACLADLLAVLHEAAAYVGDPTDAASLLRNLWHPEEALFTWRIRVA